MLIDKSFAEKKVDREFLAHEIAHQWFGNSVFPQGLGAAWLTEAFANYSAWTYAASIAGNPRVLRKRVAQAVDSYFTATAARGDQALYETDPYQPVGASTGDHLREGCGGAPHAPAPDWGKGILADDAHLRGPLPVRQGDYRGFP